jgi:acyl carrier protein
MEAAPVGVPGELFIGGAGLARGYLNRPDLTAERFLPNPLADVEGDRLYRTGDLARWGAGGALEYLGRMDNQVKLRGFRIELGEVESALRQCPGVRDAAVVAREDSPGGKRLVAYVAASEQDAEPGRWRRFLREQLPEYMTPAAFVRLDALPLTASGKLDRAALPVPEPMRESAGEPTPPRTLVEERLARIWTQLLHVERIGVEDNFFELGGHSLLATQLVSRIRDSFHLEVPVGLVFTAGFTIARLAQEIEKRMIEDAGASETAAILKRVLQASDHEILEQLAGLEEVAEKG